MAKSMVLGVLYMCVVNKNPLEVCMLSPISFRAGSLESAKDILDQPQAFAGPGSSSAPKADTFEGPKKKHSVAKAVAGTVITAAVIAGGLAATHHFGGFAKLAEKFTGEGKVSKFASKALGGLDTAGKFIKDSAVKGYEAVKGLFAKKEAPATEAPTVE